MKRYLLIFSASAAMAACTITPEFVPSPEPAPAHKVTVEAAATKTTLSGDNILWESTDKIAMFFSKEGVKSVSELSSTIEEGKTAAKSRFSGEMADEVTSENGYAEIGYAVYPSSALSDKGDVVYELPKVQTAHESGSFLSDVNLSSSKISLADLEDDGTATANFLNALSVLRVALSEDVTSVTVTGSAPFAGKAPVAFDEDGRLRVQDDDWTNASESVTLLPANGTNFEAKTYNIVVWPGEQKGLSITLNFNELGDYSKVYSVSAEKPTTLAPAKYYNLKVLNTEELVVEEMLDAITLPSIDPELDENVGALLQQIQSVSLITEYLDNAVYARYAQMTYSKQKADLSLDYIVKPESAAEALVDAFDKDPKVVSGMLGYGKGAGMELEEEALTVKDLYLSELPGIGKIVTAVIDASNIDNKFYEGAWDASVALQIVSGKTDLLSDFANLVPKAGSVITGNNLIPIVPGARVVIPFNYAVSGDDVPYTLTVTDSQGVVGATENHYDNSKTGNLTVTFADVTSGTPSVTLTLTVGEGESQEVVEYDYTFVDNGDKIILSTNGDVDYIGGDAVVEVESTLGSGSLVQTGGTGVAFDNVKVFTFEENGGYQQRTANVQYSVMANSLTYYKDVTLIQKAKGTALSRKYYVGAGENVKKLQSATNANIQNHLNIVILGDGYVQKDYAEGGLFERRATSAMENFFGIEPFKSYRDRFDVYMAGYIYDKNLDGNGDYVYEGTDNNTLGLDVHTYFDSWWDGTSTAISLAESGKTKVINAVQNDLGLTGGAYYRTIVIMLINSDANAGSTFYPEQNVGNLSGDGYHSFSVACVAANSTGFGGLVKHEAGGHAFGRLADEYITVAEGTTVSEANKTSLANAHKVGFYTNVTTDYNNYDHFKMFTNAGYTPAEVGYYEGAWRGSFGVWRSSATSIMQSSGNTGNFNAVSRYAIWRRIILQAKGIENDTMTDFVSYDQKNR